MTIRRAQTAIHIRSDKAAGILARHVRPGRSQAVVVEDALEKLESSAVNEQNDFMAKIKDIQHRAALAPWKYANIKEFDGQEYDERGNLR
jgi:hypothetical protein